MEVKNEAVPKANGQIYDNRLSLLGSKRRDINSFQHAQNLAVSSMTIGNCEKLLVLFVWLLITACSGTDDTFDINKISGGWTCQETYNSEGGELLSYQITITPTGTNSCTISKFMGVNVTVPATVSESWSITIPEYIKGTYTYWGSGKVNINKMTMTLDMSSKAGSNTEHVTANCTKK